MKLFISGNRSISSIPVKSLNLLESLSQKHGFTSEDTIIVGDASGVDAFIQSLNLPNTVVYYSGAKPRNNLNNTATVFVKASGTGRNWHTCKDVQMSEDCDIHIGFVDTTKSDWHTTGTAANHKRVTDMGKPSYLIGNNTEYLE